MASARDFLASVNRARPKGAKRSGPPVAKPSVAARLALIARTVSELCAGVPPLDVPSLDPIAVDSPELVQALLNALACPEYRAGLVAIAALGRATVDTPRVVDPFAAIIDEADARFINRVCMAPAWK
jgi:hypothetical protein